ncbi:MAG: AAA family ATPase, partial [Opitutales bacterium]
MKHTFFLAAAAKGSGLTSTALGLFRALDGRGIRVGFCKPISQDDRAAGGEDPSSAFIRQTTGFVPVEPLSFEAAERYVRNGQMEDLMEVVVQKVGERAEDVDVMIVEGLLPTETQTFPNRINRAVVSALSAEVILVNSVTTDSLEELQQSLETAASLYGGVHKAHVIGCILNKVRTLGGVDTSTAVPINSLPEAGSHTAAPFRTDVLAQIEETIKRECPIFHEGFELLGCIPWNPSLPSFRVSDVAKHLGAKALNAG